MRSRLQARAALAAVVLVIGGPLCLPAQSTARVLDSVLLPPRFYVGDRVELRLRLEVPAGVPLTAPAAGELPGGGVPGAEPPADAAGPSVRIDRIELEDRRRPAQEGEVRVRVFFSSYAPGEVTLPELNLGAVRVPPQTILTASVREREPEPGFRALRGQLLLPYSRLRLAVSILVLLGAPAAAVLLVVWTIRLWRKMRDLRRRRRPAQRARGALQRLEQTLEHTETKEVFVHLSQVLKKYLGERLEVPTSSATTAEIDTLLGGAGVAGVLSAQVREVLRAADTVKFSGRGARRSVARSSLTKVRNIVRRVEELCDVEP
jgi:hypothetical protein